MGRLSAIIANAETGQTNAAAAPPQPQASAQRVAVAGIQTVSQPARDLAIALTDAMGGARAGLGQQAAGDH
eukprot:4314471-Pyramimonas_sp.AAC.2